MALMDTAIYGLERDKWGGSWPRDGSPLTIIGLIEMFISKPRYGGKTRVKLNDLLNDYKTNLKLKQSFVNNVLSRNKVPNINNHKAKSEEICLSQIKGEQLRRKWVKSLPDKQQQQIDVRLFKPTSVATTSKPTAAAQAMNSPTAAATGAQPTAIQPESSGWIPSWLKGGMSNKKTRRVNKKRVKRTRKNNTPMKM